MPYMHDAEEFLRLHAQGVLLLDVRSPAEFAKGHIPGACSLPVFSDEERAATGIAYARGGTEAAVRVGLELVEPQLAAKLDAARALAGDRREVLMHCWRGGMRSNAMAWLLETGGFRVHLLSGGYKAYRAQVRSELQRPARMLVLGGMTGCGKTDILHALARTGSQIIDLEGLAGHRGSAFGGVGLEEQPGNETVENTLHAQWARLDFSRPIWVEDESRRIGTVTLCEEFFAHIESGPLVIVELPLPLRVRRLVRMYAGNSHDDALLRGVERIASRLGSETSRKASVALKERRYADAVSMILNYYDKAYAHQIERRIQNIVLRIVQEKDDPEKTAERLTKLEKTL